MSESSLFLPDMNSSEDQAIYELHDLQWGNWNLNNLKVMFKYRADKILMDETRRGRVKDEWVLKDEL